MIIRLFSPNSPLGQWLQFLLDALFIALAYLVCALPVVTLGAATSALYRVALNWAHKRDDCDLRNFLNAFKVNLRGGTGIWLVLLPALLLILADGYFIWLSPVAMPAIAKWMFFLAAAAWSCTASYAFALQAQFENTVLRTLGNAIRIALAHLPTTIGLLFIHAVAVFFCLLLPWLSFLFLVAAVFLAARPCWNVFSKLMPTENSEEETEGE